MMRFLRTVFWMSLPLGALAVLSPARAARRLERRAAWSIARPIRGAITGRGRRRPLQGRDSAGAISSLATDPAERPIGEAMTPEAIDGVQSWAKRAWSLFPGPATKVLTDIGRDAPVGEVRDDAKELLDDINKKQAELSTHE